MFVETMAGKPNVSRKSRKTVTLTNGTVLSQNLALFCLL